MTAKSNAVLTKGHDLSENLKESRALRFPGKKPHLMT